MKRLKLVVIMSLFGLIAYAQAPHYCDSVQADFSSSAPECTGNAVTFVNSGYSHVDCTYDWDFGADATPATASGEFPAAVTYSLAGVKEVSLTVTDVVTGCISYKNLGVMIYENPTASFNASSLSVCENETVDFSNTGSSGTGWSYSWDFGADAIPAVSTAENPLGVYWTSPGSKTVSLNITNGFCTQSTNMIITVVDAPIADFASTAPECAGVSVDFINLGSSADCTFSWNFGSGATPATSSNENPTGVVYSNHGAKIVTLTVTNTITGCSVMHTDNIVIRETPSVSFTNSGDDCLSATYDFTNTGSGGSAWTYAWDFGSGANPQVSTTENPTGIQYSTSGVKTVSLTISNSYCSSNAVQNLTVFNSPNADFASNAPVCSGLDVDFINTGSTGNHTYFWDFGAGATPATSTDENPSGIIYATSGNKTVTLTVTDNITSCTDQISKAITIDAVPNVSFTYSGDDCVSEDFDFTNTGSTGGEWSYSWDFGIGASPASSITQNPTGIVYASSGTKNVQLTITNGTCSNSVIQTVEVYETPQANFENTGPKCVGVGVDFSNTGSNTDVTYLWNFGIDANPATSTDENPMGIVYSTSGSKQVELIVTNSITGCSANIIKNVSILATPIVSLTHTDSLCLNQAFSFTNTGSTGSGFSYAWDFGQGATPATASSENPSGVVYSTSGWKYINFTISNSSCSSTILDSVFVLGTPNVDFSSTAPVCSGLSVDFTNTGDNAGVEFAWDFGADSNPATSTEENPQDIVYSQHGIKLVTLVITNTGTTCSASVTHPILIYENPVAAFSSDAPVCGDEGVDFQNAGSTGGNWTFNWNFGQSAQPASSTAENPGSVMYSTGGSKSVSLTVTNGICSSSITNDVEIFEFPEINAGADTIICANTSLLLGSPQIDNYTYLWYPLTTLDIDTIPQPVATPTAQFSSYFLTITDTITGCVSMDTIRVTMLPSAIANAGPDYEMCQGDSIQIGTGLVEGQMYFWTYNDTIVDFTGIPNPYVMPDQTTVYTLNTFYPGCDVVTDNTLVTVHPKPDVRATGIQDEDSIQIALGEEIQLIAHGGLQFEWLPGESLSNSWVYNPIAKPDTTTIYTVVGTDIYGCFNTDTIKIIVNIPGAYIPTAFTPNNDGKNDIFYIRGKGKASFELYIFDRSGELLYHSTNPDEGWDGTIQGTGRKLPSGAYVYHTKGEYTDGEIFNMTGMINLIR